MPLDQIFARQSRPEVMIMLTHDRDDPVTQRIAVPAVARSATLARNHAFSTVFAQPIQQPVNLPPLEPEQCRCINVSNRESSPWLIASTTIMRSPKPPGEPCHRRSAIHDTVCHFYLVSRRRDYDGLIAAKNRQFLWRDEQLDAARDAGLLVDQSELVEGLEHLVN